MWLCFSEQPSSLSPLSSHPKKDPKAKAVTSHAEEVFHAVTGEVKTMSAVQSYDSYVIPEKEFKRELKSRDNLLLICVNSDLWNMGINQ